MQWTEESVKTKSHEITDWVLNKPTQLIRSNLLMREGILMYFSQPEDIELLASDNELYSFGAC